MARIRTVKPALFKHEELFELEKETGLPVRLAFIGLFTCCDREGRFKWRPRALKIEVLPYDDADFSRVLDALTTRGFVRKYEVSGELFGVIPSFLKHQVINNRESKSDLPAPQESSYISSTSTREPRVDDACTTRLVQDQGEGKGKERKGKEGKEIYVASAPSVSVEDDTSSDNAPQAVREVFEHWQTVMNHPTAKLGSDRKRIISARLKDGYTVEDLQNAITGCSLSPYHMGQNEQGTRYDGLDLILRNSEKVDSFIAKFRSPPKTLGRQGLLEARNKAIGDEFVNGPNPWSSKPQGDFIDMEEQ